MKTINYIHFFIQLLFTLSAAFILIGTLLADKSAIFLMVYLAIPVGAYHVISSAVHVIYKGIKSPLSIHLLLSILYLTPFFLEAGNIFSLGLGDIGAFIAFAIPSLLAIYSIVVSFTKLNPFKNKSYESQ